MQLFNHFHRTKSCCFHLLPQIVRITTTRKHVENHQISREFEIASKCDVNISNKQKKKGIRKVRESLDFDESAQWHGSNQAMIMKNERVSVKVY